MLKVRFAQLALASLVLLALALSGLAMACGGSSGDKAAGGQVRVVTSLELFADFIRHVGGDRVQVTALIPGNADPHTYEPAPSQVAKVTKADLVIINGLGLEKTLSGLIENNVPGGVSIIEMADGLPVLAGDPNEGETGNPHLWLNVQNAMRYVEKIRDALIEVDPEGAATYQAECRRLPGGTGCAGQGDGGSHGVDTAGAAQAGHLPRRLPLFRRAVRPGDRRCSR